MSTATSIDATLVNAISQATLGVLKTMANTDVQFKGVSAKPDYVASGDISAIIGIIGDSGEGVISLSFSTELANLMVSRLLGQTPDSITGDDRCDGIGELVNMISGNAKVALSQNSETPYKLSLPTIILGSGHEVASRPKNNPYLLMTFETEGLMFHLQLSFKFR
jgi:chemotaxis protein CheX